jgi:hypothetical protein
VLAKLIFYHLTLTSSSFFFGHFGDGAQEVFAGAGLEPGSSQVARITSMSH